MNRAAVAAVLGLLAGGAVGIATPDAAACSCLFERLLAPSSGALDVPTNTLLWALSFDERAPALSVRDAAGGQVALEPAGSFGLAGGGHLHLLAPVGGLNPREAYVVDDELAGSVTFTTGEGPRSTRPPIPFVAEQSFDESTDTSCGDIASFDFQVLAGPGNVVVLDRAGEADLTPWFEGSGPGFVTTVGAERGSDRVFMSLGRPACGTVSWQDVGCEDTSVRFGALSLTGESRV